MERKIEEFAERAKRAGSPDEIEAAAKECGLELTEAQLAKLKEATLPRGETGELTDEELAGVAGGDLKEKLKRKIKELLF